MISSNLFVIVAVVAIVILLGIRFLQAKKFTQQKKTPHQPQPEQQSSQEDPLNTSEPLQRTALDKDHPLLAQVDVLIKNHDFARAESILNSALKKNTTQTELFLKLLHIYQLQHDNYAIKHLLSTVQKMQSPQLYQLLSNELELAKINLPLGLEKQTFTEQNELNPLINSVAHLASIDPAEASKPLLDDQFTSLFSQISQAAIPQASAHPSDTPLHPQQSTQQPDKQLPNTDTTLADHPQMTSMEQLVVQESSATLASATENDLEFEDNLGLNPPESKKGEIQSVETLGWDTPHSVPLGHHQHQAIEYTEDFLLADIEQPDNTIAPKTNAQVSSSTEWRDDDQPILSVDHHSTQNPDISTEARCSNQADLLLDPSIEAPQPEQAPTKQTEIGSETLLTVSHSSAQLVAPATVQLDHPLVDDLAGQTQDLDNPSSNPVPSPAIEFIEVINKDSFKHPDTPHSIEQPQQVADSELLAESPLPSEQDELLLAYPELAYIDQIELDLQLAEHYLRLGKISDAKRLMSGFKHSLNSEQQQKLQQALA